MDEFTETFITTIKKGKLQLSLKKVKVLVTQPNKFTFC